MSHHRPSGPLKQPRYSDLYSLTRSLHLSAFENCYALQKMMPNRIKTNVADVQGIGEVLWFGPSKNSTYDHNWYGNVSFKISMKALVGEFGRNFYYVDEQDMRTHTATRIVLAKKGTLCSLPRVDTGTEGAPVRCAGGNRWGHAMSNYSCSYGTVPHELEIGVEVCAEDCGWLYSRCSIEANDHSEANHCSPLGYFEPHKCHQYNTFGRPCPFRLNRRETSNRLQTVVAKYKN